MAHVKLHLPLNLFILRSIAHNAFSGTIPKELGNLTELEVL
ncbi:hypothetical protein CK203_024991 [Vitis vinifera]|uniref:Uncharacterized protein n=1 Tax=Vitis vinifera TaxID=29760 RepID=A0A438J6Z3_VITVI|nr:hypothetical protein CK203_024991 [Vitis vinifera]